MPSFSTHYIFAKELIPYLQSTADFQINEEAVLFGTQGPDIFFFHRVFPWMIGKTLRTCGSKLHRAEPSLLFENMREYCRISAEPDIAKSYVYGFLLHYALDRNCHPYVYSYQNKIISKNRLTNPHTAHNRIEFSMDTYLLHKRLNIKEPLKFNTADTVGSSTAVISEIGKLLEYTIPRTINEKVTSKQAETALRDLKVIQKICFDPIGYKRILLTPIEIIASPVSGNFKFTAMMRPKDLEKAKKYGNICNDEWKSPYSNEIRTESFEALFELSKKDAVQMLTKFIKGIDCKEITENKSFLTGVEVE
ncbi:MAG: zinc dependent phospholipase C family protein [Eubacterium sp.]|nr:zinc dependent phospholipase C family protein [Eubacterium sp.]